MQTLMICIFVLLVLVACEGSTVDTRRSIAQPVKVRRKDPTPLFLRKLSFTKSDGFTMACHVCLHLAEHFVNTLNAAERSDPTKSESGWRMDERKVVGYRGQDGKMMELFDHLCDTFKTFDSYTECSKKVCEKVPVDSTTKKHIQKSVCTEFREEFEDLMTTSARAAEDDGKIAPSLCKEIHACTGLEKIQFGDVMNPDL